MALTLNYVNQLVKGLTDKLAKQVADFGPPSGRHVRFAAPTGLAFLGGKTGVLLSSNTYYDGTNWQRYNTANPAAVFSLDAASGALTVFYATAGANPVGGWTSTYNLTNPLARPAYGITNLGAFATYGTNWAVYGGGVMPYTAVLSRDALGYVHLGGLIAKSSAVTNPDIMFTLPATMRPYNDKIFNVRTATGPSECRVGPDGRVILYSPPAGSEAWVALDQLYFESYQ